MVGLIDCGKIELTGPIYLGFDVASFCSEKDSYGLFPVDGVSVPVTFSKKLASHLYAIFFISHKKLLEYCRD